MKWVYRSRKQPVVKPPSPNTGTPRTPSFKNAQGPLVYTLLNLTNLFSVLSLPLLYLLISHRYKNGMSTRGLPATHPPKQPPNKSALTPATTRRQTASTGSLFTGRSKQDMLSNPAYSSPIQNTASVRKYLVEYALLPLEQETTHHLVELCFICPLSQVSQPLPLTQSDQLPYSSIQWPHQRPCSPCLRCRLHS